MSIYDFPNLSDEQRAVNKTIAIIENSQRHHANLEAAKKQAELKIAQDIENEKLLAKFAAEREKELEAEAEKMKKENRERGEAELRRRFFTANPDQTESDFQSVLPEMRKAEMLRRMESQQTAEDLIRNSGNYSRM